MTRSLPGYCGKIIVWLLPATKREKAKALNFEEKNGLIIFEVIAAITVVSCFRLAVWYANFLRLPVPALSGASQHVLLFHKLKVLSELWGTAIRA